MNIRDKLSLLNLILCGVAGALIGATVDIAVHPFKTLALVAVLISISVASRIHGYEDRIAEEADRA